MAAHSLDELLVVGQRQLHENRDDLCFRHCIPPAEVSLGEECCGEPSIVQNVRRTARGRAAVAREHAALAAAAPRPVEPLEDKCVRWRIRPAVGGRCGSVA